MTRILVVALLLTGLTAPLRAQWYNPDFHWERLQHRYPALQQIDNTREKSWATHAVVAVGVGHLVGVLPGVSRRQGMQALCSFYIGREFYGLFWQGNRKWVDIAGDMIAPCGVVAIVRRWVR